MSREEKSMNNCVNWNANSRMQRIRRESEKRRKQRLPWCWTRVNRLPLLKRDRAKRSPIHWRRTWMPKPVTSYRCWAHCHQSHWRSPESATSSQCWMSQGVPMSWPVSLVSHTAQNVNFIQNIRILAYVGVKLFQWKKCLCFTRRKQFEGKFWE